MEAKLRPDELTGDGEIWGRVAWIRLQQTEKVVSGRQRKQQFQRPRGEKNVWMSLSRK